MESLVTYCSCSSQKLLTDKIMYFTTCYIKAEQSSPLLDCLAQKCALTDSNYCFKLHLELLVGIRV